MNSFTKSSLKNLASSAVAQPATSCVPGCLFPVSTGDALAVFWAVCFGAWIDQQHAQRDISIQNCTIKRSAMLFIF